MWRKVQNTHSLQLKVLHVLVEKTIQSLCYNGIVTKSFSIIAYISDVVSSSFNPYPANMKNMVSS